MNGQSKTMTTNISRAALHAAVLIAIAGCKVGPNYSAPSATVSDGFTQVPEGPAPGTTSLVTRDQEDIAAWWQVFGDPLLNSLVQRAEERNHDLRIAVERVREARAQRRSTASDQYPTLDADASYSRSRASENYAGPFEAGDDRDLYQYGFDAAWEIDVFGRVARGVEAADADLAASIENRRDVLVTVVAEVARNYTELRASQVRLALARRSVDAEKAALEIAQARFDAQLTSELDVAQARAQLSTRLSSIQPLEVAIRQSVHRLGVLLGQEPAALESELLATSEVDAAIPVPPPTVGVGAPADLLRRRPDIRLRERELAAATARIGVARADLYPRFSLNGSFAMEASNTGDLFDLDSRNWSVTPAVRWNMFDGGRIRALINAAGAREQQALARYEQTVLKAMEETENAVVGFVKEQTRGESLASAVESNRRAVSLATELYTGGLSDFRNVLDNRQRLYQSEDELARSRLTVSSGLIAIYKSLGGGWESELKSPETAPDSEEASAPATAAR
jgi:multidrug efflux system outer membrane protein